MSATTPATTPPTPAKRASPARRALVIVVLAGVGLWAASFLYHLWRYEKTDDAYVAGHLHQIAPQIDDQVVQVLAHENETVRQGQVLVRLDPVPFQLGVDQAQANLSRAKADLAQADAAIAQAGAGLAQAKAAASQAEAQVAQAQAQDRLANLTLERDARMSTGESRAVTPAEMDAAHASADSHKAGVAAAQANQEARRAAVASARSEETAAAAQRQSAEARVAAGEAELRDAQRRLSYVEIKAPAAGRIGAKSVEVGNRVQTGQTLMVVVEPDVWIEANFKETQLARMKVGLPVEITIDAVPGRTIAGHIVSFAPASGAQFALLPADNATGNFTKVVQRVPVRIAFEPSALSQLGDRLFPGLSAVVDIKVR